MKNSFLKRVGRIVSGNVNSLLEMVEGANVEAVMEETIREIDSAIEDLRHELGKSVAQNHLALKSLTELETKHGELTKKIEFAVNEERDDLAEAAIKQQLDVEAQIPVLKNTIENCKSQVEAYEGYLSALKAKKREMREEFQILVDGMAKAEMDLENKGAPTKGTSVRAKVEKATDAFDRIAEKQTNLCKSKGYDLDNEVKLSELTALEEKSKVQERLDAFKSKVG